MKFKLLLLSLIFLIVIVSGNNNSTLNIKQSNITNTSVNTTVTITPTVGPAPTICPAPVIPTPITVTVTKEVEKIVYKDRVVEKEPDEGRLYNIRRNADIQFVKDAAMIGGISFGMLYMISILIRGFRKND